MGDHTRVVTRLYAARALAGASVRVTIIEPAAHNHNTGKICVQACLQEVNTVDTNSKSPLQVISHRHPHRYPEAEPTRC
jgi:hypothetical protein